jgi:hypothetical protein
MLDQLGICIVNKAMQIATDEEQIKKIIIILSDHIVPTIQSPYGNYAITTAIEVMKQLINFLDLGIRDVRKLNY